MEGVIIDGLPGSFQGFHSLSREAQEALVANEYKGDFVADSVSN